MKHFIHGKEVEFVRVPFTILKEDWAEYVVGDYLVKVKPCLSEMFLALEATTENQQPLVHIVSQIVIAMHKRETV